MASKMQAKAVRILSIDSDRRWKLEYDELKRILLNERVKDKPVVVVSIAGAFRQGKSFLMNFFVRYMRSQGSKNWLGDPKEPLEGFPWEYNSERVTTGILIWNEVFLVKTSDNQEVAVILMDTQGLFDCKSTNAESASIFAVSVMASSVQIYNILHTIQEDHLQNLEFFTQYGQLTQKEETLRQFQRLVFLVRDSPTETYGADAGRRILEGRLDPTKVSQPELKSLRSYIQSCYSVIDYFLMPHPGKEVTTKKSFNGHLTSIDQEFIDQLQVFVPWILAPENLLVKKINGRKICCRDLLVYFQAYVRASEESQLPAPKTLMQATAEASNLIAKDKATKVYMAVMSHGTRGDLQKLREMHIEALARAKDVFDNMPKMGGDQLSKQYLDTLIEEMEEYYGIQRIAEEDRLNEELEKEKRQVQKAEMVRKLREEVARKMAEENIIAKKVAKTAEVGAFALAVATATWAVTSVAIPITIPTAVVGAGCAAVALASRLVSSLKKRKEKAA